jgi:hypothetical protein
LGWKNGFGLRLVRANVDKVIKITWLFPNTHAVDPIRKMLLFHTWSVNGGHGIDCDYRKLARCILLVAEWSVLKQSWPVKHNISRLKSNIQQETDIA